MALVTTPGAANANSYPSVAEADAYCATHPYASGWTVFTTPQKEALLITATRLIDVMPGAWAGAAVTATQALGFPRNGLLSRNGFPIANTVVPNDLKIATSEYARQLGSEDLTETSDIQKLGITSLKAGSVQLSFKEGLSQKDIARPSNRAGATAVPDAVKQLIPSNWLVSVAEQEADEGLGVLLLNL